LAVRKIEIDEKSFNISYEILNPNLENDLIFLHGWGSNKEIMKNSFGKLFKDFRHIYIDLPGFGKSSSGYIMSSYDYAKVIEKFLSELNIKKDFILGHSFGGKIATLLNPKTLILLSSAGVVKQKSLKVRAKIAIFKLLKPLKPLNKSLYKLFATSDVKGMSREMYETLKVVVDEDFSEIFKNFTNRAFIFWGIKDSATPLSSGEKIHSLIKNSLFFPLDGDHFFFVNHKNFIEEQILKERN